MRPESEFTAPHPFAPHPEWWHAVDAESTEEEVGELVAAFVRALQPELVVETGTHIGRTTVKIARALRQNGHGHLVGLEVDAERALLATCRVQAEAPGWATVLRRSSLEFEPEAPIDLLFSDSAYEVRAQEIRRFRRWMTPRSIILIHDWTSGIRGHYRDIRADVEALRRDGVLDPVYVPTPRGLVVAAPRLG